MCAEILNLFFVTEFSIAHHLWRSSPLCTKFDGNKNTRKLLFIMIVIQRSENQKISGRINFLHMWYIYVRSLVGHKVSKFDRNQHVRR